MITDKLGGRKFVFAVLVVFLAYFLVLTSKVEAREFLAFVGVIGTTYVVGNVMDKKTIDRK